MSKPTYIATRKSPLALIQTQAVLEHLRGLFPGEPFEALPLSTKVDERLNWSLEQRGGIGLFTKELEEALLDDRATLAVHSAKDLPTKFQADLCIAGYLPRARANDVLVRRAADKSALKTIATSSPRRRAQVLPVGLDAVVRVLAPVDALLGESDVARMGIGLHHGGRRRRLDQLGAHDPAVTG